MDQTQDITAILDLCATCYKKDLVEVIRSRWAIAPKDLATLQDIVDLFSKSTPEDRRLFVEECRSLPRKKKRRLNAPTVTPQQNASERLADGRDPQEVFKDFSKVELQGLVGRFIGLTNKMRSSRNHILGAVCNVPSNLQTLITRAAERLKTPRQRQDTRASVPRPTTNPVGNTAASSSDWNDSQYLQPPSEDVIKSCTRAFIERTGAASMAMTFCVVCAREQYVRDTHRMEVCNIPNPSKLQPSTPHPAQELTMGMLLHPRTYAPNEEVAVCYDCLRTLEKDKTPRLSLANNMWLGEVPRELKGLTLPERILIGLYIPVAHVVKLYPKKLGATNMTSDSLYDGLRGNVSSFPLDQRLIAEMLTNVKPAPLELLTATIGITFVGPKNVPSRWLHGRLPSNFQVRRHKVAKALLWLVENNPLYANVKVCQERLASLPENAVPEELYTITRISEDTEALHQEQMNYVPDMEDDPSLYAPEGDVGDFQEHDDDGEDFVEPWDDDEVEMQEQPPAVIPIQNLGVVDANGEGIPERELLAHALANSVHPQVREDNYMVRHGTAFVNEYARKDPATDERFDGGPDNPSHLLGAFPTLFPYARGGFETYRPLDVTYEQHSAWALQYADKRFRRDSHFIFQIFGVRQKREVCRSATLQIDQPGLQRHSHLLALLKPGDLLKASEEESARRPNSNPAVRALRQHLKAIRKRVVGTDESRFVVRSEVWGTSLLFNQPSLWITINPADIHCPIAQVLTGADINLDDFVRTAGPDSAKRSSNIAGDPYASSKYFHLIVQAVLETLLGIEVSKSRPPRRREGIFGIVQAYVGTVEAQGRGTLHLHLLVWLRHAPTPSRLKEMLQSEEFRLRVKEYLEATLCADIEGKTTAEVEALPIVKDISYSRPTNPDLPAAEFRVARRRKVNQLARVLQYHKCGPTRCLKKIRGVFMCKRRAPWKRSEETWVSTTGEHGPRRICGFLNAWNDTMLDTLRCNHDVQLLLALVVITRIIWYITNYATKKQQRSSNVTAVLAKRLAFHNAQEKARGDATNRNKRLLERCANALTRDREFSAPEVVSYLMGWGDRYESHTYVPIFWVAAERALYDTFDLRGGKDNDDGDEAPRTQVSFSSGTAELHDQMKDYMYRGEGLEGYCFFDFLLGTYEEKIPVHLQAAQSDEVVDEDLVESGDEGTTVQRRGPGRPSNLRVRYKAEARKHKKWRVVRTAGHETLPRFAGKWPPPNDEPSRFRLYCASMLLLFKPWRKLVDIQGDHGSLEDAFETYRSNCSPRDATVMANLQFYHQSARDAREDALASHADEEQWTEPGENGTPMTREERERQDAQAIEEILENVTEEDIAAAERGKIAEREWLYAENALMVARNAGVLPIDSTPVPDLVPAVERIQTATEEQIQLLGQWKASLETATRDGNGVAVAEASDFATVDEEPRIREEQPPMVITVPTPLGASPLISMLNEEQMRAHDIIVNHLVNHLEASIAQTIEKVLVDLEKPPSGHLSPFNVYVALSRSRGRDHIRLLRGFDESLVTVHPSEDLRLEMQRLRVLHHYTSEWWRNRNTAQ